jgi:hypothetical protein
MTYFIHIQKYYSNLKGYTIDKYYEAFAYGITSLIKRINQIKVKSETSNLTDVILDESEINKHELNIDQKEFNFY